MSSRRRESFSSSRGSTRNESGSRQWLNAMNFGSSGRTVRPYRAKGVGEDRDARRCGFGIPLFDLPYKIPISDYEETISGLLSGRECKEMSNYELMIKLLDRFAWGPYQTGERMEILKWFFDVPFNVFRDIAEEARYGCEEAQDTGRNATDVKSNKLVFANFVIEVLRGCLSRHYDAKTKLGFIIEFLEAAGVVEEQDVQYEIEFIQDARDYRAHQEDQKDKEDQEDRKSGGPNHRDYEPDHRELWEAEMIKEKIKSEEDTSDDEVEDSHREDARPEVQKPRPQQKRTNRYDCSPDRNAGNKICGDEHFTKPPRAEISDYDQTPILYGGTLGFARHGTYQQRNNAFDAPHFGNNRFGEGSNYRDNRQYENRQNDFGYNRSGFNRGFGNSSGPSFSDRNQSRWNENFGSSSFNDEGDRRDDRQDYFRMSDRRQNGDDRRYGAGGDRDHQMENGAFNGRNSNGQSSSYQMESRRDGYSGFDNEGDRWDDRRDDSRRNDRFGNIRGYDARGNHDYSMQNDGFNASFNGPSSSDRNRSRRDGSSGSSSFYRGGGRSIQDARDYRAHQEDQKDKEDQEDRESGGPNHRDYEPGNRHDGNDSYYTLKEKIANIQRILETNRLNPDDDFPKLVAIIQKALQITITPWQVLNLLEDIFAIPKVSQFMLGGVFDGSQHFIAGRKVVQIREREGVKVCFKQFFNDLRYFVGRDQSSNITKLKKIHNYFKGLSPLLDDAARVGAQN